MPIDYERLGYMITDEKIDHARHEDYTMVKNLMPPQITAANREELYEIAVFLDDCWKVEYREILPSDYLDSLSADERYQKLLSRFDETPLDFLVMRDAGRLVGVSIFGKSYTDGYPNDGEISAVYLRHDYIGKGHGHSLFAQVEAALTARGYAYFVLDVLNGNNRAIAFYQKHGYEIVAERTICLGDIDYPLTVFRKNNDLKKYSETHMADFLRETAFIDFSNEGIRTKADELFRGVADNTEKARIAYEFVRDKIPHSFDIDATVITAKASDVLIHETGICHAKANLLAALLRSQNIPVGFCFQHLTLMDDDSAGYCVHCYNAVLLDGHWVKLDARGNKPGVDAQFSLDAPVLAFLCRSEYDEYFWQGIYASPHMETMQMLGRAKNLQDVFDNIPDTITKKPDIPE